MNKKSAIFSVMLADVLWGIIGIFVNRLVDLGFNGAQISFLRVLTCAVMMGVFLFIYDRKLLKIRLKDVWMFLGTGIVSLTLFSYCYFTTMIHVEVSIAVALLYTSPVFVMLFSAILFREKITVKKVIAILLTVVGCALVSGMVGSRAGMGFTSLLVGVGAGFFYALYSIFGRFATGKYHPFTITFYTFVFASLGFLLFVNPVEAVATMTKSADGIWLVLFSGVLCGILPYIFYTAGLKQLDTGVAGVLVAVEPLVGGIVGIVGYGESANPVKILGIVMILVSLVILSMTPKGETDKCTK